MKSVVQLNAETPAFVILARVEARRLASSNKPVTEIPPQRPPRFNDHPNHTKMAENTHFSTTHNSTTLRLIALQFDIQKDIMLNNCFVI
jgi:hypothetical protein